MAVKRIDPKATFKVVCQQDDALENESEAELEALKTIPDSQSRYQKFLESFDLNDLKFKEAAQPDIFVVRALSHAELADINERYFSYDTVEKRLINRNRSNMLVEMFDKACLGVEQNGQVTKITATELPFAVVVELGGIINLIGILGKNLKKA
jgi:hypothetical protein